MSDDGSWRRNISRTRRSVNFYGTSGSWLIFESGNSPWGLALFRVRLNGDMREQLLAEENFSHYRFMQPGLSPDGTQLAYFGLSGSDTALHIFADNNDVITHQLPLDTITDNTIWSLDSGWILFVGSVNRELYLFRANAAGFESFLRLDSPIRFDNLSPDGSWLAVQSSTGYFALINIHTGQMERLPGDVIEFLGWSPDGTQFFIRSESGILSSSLTRPSMRRPSADSTYTSISPFRNTITIIETDGTVSVRDRGGMVRYYYSTSGERYFVNEEWQYFVDEAIFRTQPRTSNFERLTFFQNNEQIVTWSPDKQWLYFTTNTDIYNQVMYRMRPDGANIQEVTRHSSVVSASLTPGGFVTWIYPPDYRWAYPPFLIGWFVLLVGSAGNCVYNHLN